MSSPPSVIPLLQDGIRLHRAGRLIDAAARYAAVLRLDQRNFDALHLGGMVALQQGHSDQALRLLGAAHRVNPRDQTCSLRLALAERAGGQLEAAERRLRELTRQTPPLPEAWDNLGHVLKARGALAEARTCHEQATQLAPEQGLFWYNLGHTDCLLGEPAQGLQAQERALQAGQPYPRALYGRALAYQQLHRLEEALASYAAHLQQEPGHLAAHSARLLCRQYLDTFDTSDHLAALAAWRANLPRPARIAPRVAGERRLRIGFVSADFRRHSVAWFMLPLLRHLDRSAFVITLYHDHGITDEISAAFRRLADVWRETLPLSGEDFVKTVRHDHLDLVVDLGGHTGGNRLAAFAQRLAPVQISYLGFPDTTAVPAMDYRFVDPITDPDHRDDARTDEQLVRFAPTAWAYQPPPEAEPGQVGPGAQGGPVTFGSFNNFAKVSPATLRVWAQVLGAVPDSRLVLKSPGLSAAAGLAAVAAHGIDPARVEILPGRPDTASHLADYAHIDIALDPLPYHGTTTTCEALWMGRPVVTLRGQRHASRVGASLLTAVGRESWIALDPAAYVACAASLAADRESLARWHSGALRAALQASAVLDHRAQAQRFGAALQACWDRHTRGEAPHSVQAAA